MTLTDEEKQIYGLDSRQLVPYQYAERSFLLHREALDAFIQLQGEARKAGFDMQPVSSYRSFDRQMAIWNGKAVGKRPLLDAGGAELDVTAMNDQQRLEAILRWSAVPGLSRHHWGSDLDVFDAGAMALEDVQLVPAEVDSNGPCSAMHEWLNERITANSSFGYFRPYSNQACKVAEEKWHLSYLPLAVRYTALMDINKLLDLWQEKQLLLLDALIDNHQSIFHDYACLKAHRLPGWVAEALAL